jgi:hypothetical protein
VRNQLTNPATATATATAIANAVATGGCGSAEGRAVAGEMLVQRRKLVARNTVLCVLPFCCHMWLFFTALSTIW